MSKDVIYLPVPRRLYEDVVRLSDGKCDLIALALDQFHEFIRRTAVDEAHGLFGTRLGEFLKIYHPDVLANLYAFDTTVGEVERKRKLAPLIWKEVEVPAGSLVRMTYSGAYHEARVESGQIVDSEGHYTPSEWASKVAQNTSRNAWRDLYFRFPGSTEWVSASLLREKRRSEMVGAKAATRLSSGA